MLRSNRRTDGDQDVEPSSSAPTYASVVRLASATRRHQSPFGTVTYIPGTRNLGTDDVDRSEELDDLDPGSISTWRPTARNRDSDSQHPADRIRRDESQQEEERDIADDALPYPPLVSLDELIAEGANGGDDGGGGVPGLPVSSPAQIFSPRLPRIASDLTRLPAPTTDSSRFGRSRSSGYGGPLRGQASRRLFGLPQGLRMAGSSDTDDDREDLSIDLDADEPTFEWTPIEPTEMRRSGGIYGQHNRTEEDLTVLGGSGGAINLRRGMFNGRRRSVIDRLRELESVRPVQGVVNQRNVVPSASSIQRLGLPPTNTGMRDHTPILVNSDNEQKRKSIQNNEPVERLSKRRKLSAGDSVKPIVAPDRPSYLSFTTTPTSLVLPTTFDKPTMRSNLSLTTHSSATCPPRPCVTFTLKNLPGGPKDDDYASSLRAEVPIPPECGIHYYEVEVLDAGENGYISVGWMKKDNKLNRLVGWDKGSLGWHGDDGRSFGGCSSGTPFSEGWTVGDTVGCGINFIQKRAFFTKNGKMIGHVFDNVDKDLYPAVGLRTPRESVVVNFTGPFVFDIDSMVKAYRNTVLRAVVFGRNSHNLSPALPPAPSLESILSSRNASKSLQPGIYDNPTEPFIPGGEEESKGFTIPPSSAYTDVNEKLPAAFVLDYLRHEGFGKTLSLVKKDMASSGRIHPSTEKVFEMDSLTEDAKMEDFPDRDTCLAWLKQKIIQSDKTPLPWALINQTVESRDQRCLKIHHILHLLRRSEETRDDTIELFRDYESEALGYARKVQQETKFWSVEERWNFAGAVSLLGSAPSSWPEDGISGRKQREADAEKVIAAARVKLGIKPESYLSLAFSQVSASLKFIAPDEPLVTFIDPTGLLNDPGSYHATSKALYGEIRLAPKVKETESKVDVK